MASENDSPAGFAAMQIVAALMLELRREGPLYVPGFERVLNAAQEAVEKRDDGEAAMLIAALRKRGSEDAPPEF